MKRSTILIALALGTVLSAVPALAQPGTEGGPNDKAAKLPCPRVAFSSVEQLQATGRSFSAAQSTDLIFHVIFDRSLEEDHVVTLKVFTPRGHLYRRIDVPLVSVEESGSQGARRLPGYPYPVPEHAPKTVKLDGRKYESVELSFPVAGSAIVTSSLYGRWEVEVYLDAAGEPCGRRTFFHLRE